MPLTELARIDKHIDIDAPPERVWQALTDRQRSSSGSR